MLFYTLNYAPKQTHNIKHGITHTGQQIGVGGVQTTHTPEGQALRTGRTPNNGGCRPHGRYECGSPQHTFSGVRTCDVHGIIIYLPVPAPAPSWPRTVPKSHPKYLLAPFCPHFSDF